MTLALKRWRVARPAAVIPAAISIASAMACASAIRIEEPIELVSADAAPSLASGAIADLATHGDLLVEPPDEAAFTTGPSDGVRTIERGTYAGMRVPVRIEAALGGEKKSEHFWRVPKSSGKNMPVVGWRSSRYPLPVALRRSSPWSEISADDSAAFWETLAQMSADAGIALFRPVTVPVGDPVDVIIVDVRQMEGKDGFSRASWSSSGELFDVRVTFGSRSVLHNAHVVAHEMTHALGFGHTRSWPSVVNPGNRGTDRLTPADVAYIELAMRLRERRERADMRQLIALAVERETPGIRRSEVYPTCADTGSDPFGDEVPMRKRTLLPIGLLTVVSDCAMRQD